MRVPMNKVVLLLVMVMGGALSASERIDEVKWLTAKDAFEKARTSGQWVLIYKEWPG